MVVGSVTNVDRHRCPASTGWRPNYLVVLGPLAGHLGALGPVAKTKANAALSLAERRARCVPDRTVISDVERSTADKPELLMTCELMVRACMTSQFPS